MQPSSALRRASQTQRALPDGTAEYAGRFANVFTPDFYRLIPSGVTVSSIGLGSYLGDCSDEVDAAYTETVVAAFESGVNFIDTAPNYRAQRSERAVGAALQQAIAAETIARDAVIVCTKGGYLPLDGSIPATKVEYQNYIKRTYIEPGILHADDIVSDGHTLAPRFLRYSIAQSRQNLGIQTVDMFLLHNPEQQLSVVGVAALKPRVRAAFATLEEAVERGEIGAYGCSSWNAFRLAPNDPAHLEIAWFAELAGDVAGDAHHFRAIQMPINLAMPEGIRQPFQTVKKGSPAVTAVQAANELGLAVFASASLMQGRLASGIPDQVKELLPKHDTDAQRAIAFVRGLPGVTSALVGTRDPAHLAENLGAARP